MDLDHNKSLKSQTKNEVIDTGIALKDDPEYSKVSIACAILFICDSIENWPNAVGLRLLHLVFQNA